MKIFAIGDICGEVGLKTLGRLLGTFKKLKGIDFTVANGENAAGMGIAPRDAERIYGAGVDVITLGNHAWGRRELLEYIDDDRYMLRPANMTDKNPGGGFGVFDAPRGTRIAVISMLGRLFMDANMDNPFFKADAILKQIDTPIILLDFHAEATSEKAAFARYLDGRASAVFGTHTHVQTADEQIFAGGTGFISDLGMTGPENSILGIEIENAISIFIGKPRKGSRQAEGKGILCGAIFEVDENSGKCLAVERVRLVD